MTDLDGLVWLVENHYEPLEADFQREYGLDLREVLWGERPFGVRRIASLIRGLPLGSALHRSLDSNGWGAGWRNQEELLAAIAELLDFNNRILIQINSKKGATQPQPLKIPRPSDPKPRLAEAHEMKALIRGQGIPIVNEGG